LLLLHDVLPKDTLVHDGLQLIDGSSSARHPIQPTAAAAAPPLQVPTTTPPSATPPQPATAPALPAPVVVGAAPEGLLLPIPSQPMRLEALPPHTAGRGAVSAPAVHAARVDRRDERDGDWDEEEDDEIRPVAYERAAQWRAHRAAGF